MIYSNSQKVSPLAYNPVMVLAMQRMKGCSDSIPLLRASRVSAADEVDIFDFHLTEAKYKTSLAGDYLDKGSETFYVIKQYDLSGNGNHSEQVTEPNQPLLDWVSGKWFLDFDGSNDYMQVLATSASVLQYQQTVFASVKNNNDPDNFVPIVGYQSISYAPSLRIKNSIYPLIFLGSNNYRYFAETYPINDNNFHNVLFYTAGSGINDILNSALYSDGKAENIQVTLKTGEVAAKTHFYIGKSGSHYAKIHLTNLLCFDRELKKQEIYQLSRYFS